MIRARFTTVNTSGITANRLTPTCHGVPKLVHEVFSVRDFRPNGRHAQTLGDPVQRYASLGQLSGIGFGSVRDPLGRHGRRTRLVACVFALSIGYRSTWAALA
jgi:hypothetical protein